MFLLIKEIVIGTNCIDLCHDISNPLLDMKISAGFNLERFAAGLIKYLLFTAYLVKCRMLILIKVIVIGTNCNEVLSVPQDFKSSLRYGKNQQVLILKDSLQA